MNWFIFAIISGIGFAASRVISRALLKKQGDALAFTAINDFIAGLVLLPFVFISFHLPENPITWLYFGGIVIFAFLADWISFIALKKVDVAEYQIINQSRHIFILVGGLLVFSETIGIAKMLAITLIIGGVIISQYEGNKIKVNKGALLALVSTFFAVVAFVFAKLAVRDFSESAAAAIEFLFIGIICFALLKLKPAKIIDELRMQRWGIVVAGCIYGIFELTLFFALKSGEASKVVPVTQVSLIITLLAGILFLNERERIVQKILGISTIAAGIALIYLI